MTNPESIKPALSHSIVRTSPMGGPFIGTCTQCGQDGLKNPWESECENVRRVSQEDALLEIIRGGN